MFTVWCECSECQYDMLCLQRKENRRLFCPNCGKKSIEVKGTQTMDDQDHDMSPIADRDYEC